LYPKAHSFQFYSESIKFILILLAITVTGYIIVCIRLGKYLPTFSMFVTLLDLISTSIPPTLPTAMSVGIGFAIQRLSEIGIKCTLPQKILVGGQVETVCFEKTGTLTKKEVSVVGFALCENGRMTGILTSPNEIKQSRYAQTAFEVMACCHSVTKSAASEHLGKPIDTAMLEFSKGEVISNNT
jgi:cation-transporting ATPase 13A2